MSSSIIAYGSYVPEKVLTNSDLESMVDTSDEWIIQRTGIKERRLCQDSEFTSHIAIQAVEDLVSRFPNALEGVDQIILASMTPDYYCPNTASLVQAHFGLKGCGATDINTACSGFVYALGMGNGLISSGFHKKVLVIGADAMSKIVDYTDRTTCILFGDGAGAFVLEASDQSDFLASYKNTQGNLAEHLYCTGLSKAISGGTKKSLNQNGKEVYKWVVQHVPKAIKTLVSSADLSLEDIDWFIPHSANMRILEAISDRLSYPLEKLICTIEEYGNTSAGTIPLAFVKGIDNGDIRPGQRILMHGFGGGLTQAGLVVKLSSI